VVQKSDLTALKKTLWWRLPDAPGKATGAPTGAPHGEDIFSPRPYFFIKAVHAAGRTNAPKNPHDSASAVAPNATTTTTPLLISAADQQDEDVILIHNE
jgi:hypothetical protein